MQKSTNLGKKLPFSSKPRAQYFGDRKKVALDDDDDDDDEKDQVELLHGFEDNKVKGLHPKEERAPLSIAPLANADWRALAKKKKQLYMPAQAQDPSTATSQAPEVISQSVTSFGLQVPTKANVTDGAATTAAATVVAVEEERIQSSIEGAGAASEETPKSLEAQAIEAIIQESTNNDTDAQNGPTLVIPNETESFRDDVRNRPDETTMEDYENVPVEEFGAALLRGLGWNQGEGIGRNRKNITPPVVTPIKQRDSLLGLGAKPQEASKDKDDKKKSSRKSGYEYKESSLFKKISKRRIEDDDIRNYSRRRESSASAASSPSSSDRSRERESTRLSSSSPASSSSRSPKEYRDHHRSASHSSRRRRSSRSRSRSPRRSQDYGSRSSSSNRSWRNNDRPRDGAD